MSKLASTATPSGEELARMLAKIARRLQITIAGTLAIFPPFSHKLADRAFAAA